MSSNPYIVAELSASHHGSLDRAHKIIDAAKDAGADAIKLQTMRPEDMVVDREYVIDKGPWKGERLYELYKRAMLPWGWHLELFRHARDIELEIFSTPFSIEAVEFLEDLDCPMYKIASFELTDLSLIKAVASTGKPVIMSTGMATEDEIQRAVNMVRACHPKSLTLLKCTSSYPAPIEEANLATMGNMRARYQCGVGVSDHSRGNVIAAVATALGADMIEKHITLDDEEGPDSKFAMRPDEFKRMVNAVRTVSRAIGSVNYGPTKGEVAGIHLRRSLYALQPIKSGEKLSPNNIGARRPAMGLSPDHLSSIIGRHARIDIDQGSPITIDMLG